MSFDSCLQELAYKFIGTLPLSELHDPLKLMFHAEKAHWFYLDYCTTFLRKLPFKVFCEKLFEKLQFEIDLKSYIKEYSKHKESIPVCGTIIFNQKGTKLLFVETRGILSFPKGKKDEGETDVQCAIRETKEEAGIDISSQIDSCDFIEFELRKKVKFFLIRGVDDTKPYFPRTTNEITKVRWIKISSILKMDVPKIVSAALEKLDLFPPQKKISFSSAGYSSRYSLVSL